MKYLEELSFGDCFSIKDHKYILTCDFRVKNDKHSNLCISIIDGRSCWFNSDTIVEKIELYYINNDKNIVAIKETDNDSQKNTNIY